MAKATLFKYRDAGGSADQNSNLTNYLFCANANFSANATETNRQFTYRTAGTLSNLWIRVTANTLNGSTTFRTRKNLADGNQSVSVGSSTTGAFEDTVNTDSVAAADEINYQRVTAGTAGTITMQDILILFAATSNTVNIHGGSGAATTFNSSTEYAALAGVSQFVSSEIETQLDFNTAGTLKNLFLNISANTRTTTSTLNVRVAGADSGVTVSVTASSTGIFEDTTNSGTVAANDDCNFALTQGAGGGTLTMQGLKVEFETTNSKFQTEISNVGGTTQSANLTRYMGFGGNIGIAETTEADAQTELNIAATFSNLFVYVSANTVTAASTFDIRDDAASTAVTISIGSSTTGQFEDAVNTVALTATDMVNLRLLTGATGTSLTLRIMGCMLENTEGGVANYSTTQFLTLTGVGI